MIAYFDDFHLMMWLTLAAEALAPPMRRNHPPAGPVTLSE